MAHKRALYLTYGEDSLCKETMKFIQDAGVILDVRDIATRPLSEGELNRLIGHLEISHFINTLSDSYTKFRLDKHLPSRGDIIRLMAKDHTLLRRPIVKASRLLTVGCDKRKIAEMLQISPDGHFPEESATSTAGVRPSRPSHRRHSAAAGK